MTAAELSQMLRDAAVTQREGFTRTHKGFVLTWGDDNERSQEDA